MNIGAVTCFYICSNYTQPEASNLSERYRMISLSATRCRYGLHIQSGANVTCHGLHLVKRWVSSDVCKILCVFKLCSTYSGIFWWVTWGPA